MDHNLWYIPWYVQEFHKSIETLEESDDDHDDDHGIEADQNSTENNNSEVPKVSIVGHYHVCFISYQVFTDFLYFR